MEKPRDLSWSRRRFVSRVTQRPSETKIQQSLTPRLAGKKLKNPVNEGSVWPCLRMQRATAFS
jgi:hypothetical protein